MKRSTLKIAALTALKPTQEPSCHLTNLMIVSLWQAAKKLLNEKFQVSNGLFILSYEGYFYNSINNYAHMSNFLIKALMLTNF